MNIEDHTFSKLKEFVEDSLDFSITYYNDEYLRRRLRSRMRRTKCDDLGEYYHLLQDDEEEQQELLKSLSINVTGFFRNEDVWSRVREILREKTQLGERCRVWSAGCADGREPYSVALLAASDREINQENLEIVGTDINTEALSKARKGEYNNTVTDDIEDQLSFLSRPKSFVTWDSDKARVGENIRDMVTFREHDLIQDPSRKWFDLVFCRNVLIYLKRSHEEEIFETITSCANDGAFVVIGKAETLPSSLETEFESVNPALRIYRYDG